MGGANLQSTWIPPSLLACKPGYLRRSEPRSLERTCFRRNLSLLQMDNGEHTGFLCHQRGMILTMLKGAFLTSRQNSPIKRLYRIHPHNYYLHTFFHASESFCSTNPQEI